MELDARRERKTLTMSTRDGATGSAGPTDGGDGDAVRFEHALESYDALARLPRGVAPPPSLRRRVADGREKPARARSRQPRRRARSARPPPDASTTPRVNPRAGDCRESVDRCVSCGRRQPCGSTTRRRVRRRLPSRRKTASTVALARDDAVIPSSLRPGAVWAGVRAARELGMVATMRTLRNFTMFPFPCRSRATCARVRGRAAPMHRAFDARLKPQNPCARVAHFRKSIMDRLTTLHWAKSRLENGGSNFPTALPSEQRHHKPSDPALRRNGERV